MNNGNKIVMRIINKGETKKIIVHPHCGPAFEQTNIYYYYQV